MLWNGYKKNIIIFILFCLSSRKNFCFKSKAAWIWDWIDRFFRGTYYLLGIYVTPVWSHEGFALWNFWSAPFQLVSLPVTPKWVLNCSYFAFYLTMYVWLNLSAKLTIHYCRMRNVPFPYRDGRSTNFTLLCRYVVRFVDSYPAENLLI